ncbi:MAG: hypothetical protein Q7R93_02920 [bacterium]|nr:hypothetical protein [bacterium]
MKKICLIVLLLGPLIASAHAFGQQYTLPLPVSFYMLGGVSAFLASCAFLVLVGHKQREPKEYAFQISRSASILFGWCAKGLTLLLFLLCIGAGLFGSQEATENILILFFWIGLILGVPYASVLLGGWWEIVNPFKQVVSWFVRSKNPPSRRLDHPPLGKEELREWKHGYVPAVIGYIVLIILELFFTDWGTTPLFLAIALILYTLYLCIGSFVYGTANWFKYADFFSLFFRLAGMLAPVRLKEGKLVFASPVSRLVRSEATHLSLTVFIIFGLAATAFDGFRETSLMYAIAKSVPFFSFAVWNFLMFILIALLFLCLFWGAMATMKKLVKGDKPVRYYVLRFTLSLVPIMLAYHFAHYFSLLLSSGPYAVTLISDPFNLGWNLFGTASYRPPLIIGADTIWYIQLAVIVLGHSFAAYIAHRIALTEFVEKRKALLSQLPLLVLMVFYTAFGLWILAQPFAGIF